MPHPQNNPLASSIKRTGISNRVSLKQERAPEAFNTTLSKQPAASYSYPDLSSNLG